MKEIEEIRESGIEPLQMVFQSVTSTEFGDICAQRSFLKINSLELGVLMPEQYQFVTMRNNLCVELFFWNFSALCTKVKDFLKFENNTQWVSLFAPLKVLTKDDFIPRLKKLMEENDFEQWDKICFEFPEELLYEDEQSVRVVLDELSALGFKLLLFGYGGEFSPLARLCQYKLDFVITNEFIGKSMNDNKIDLAMPAINFASQCGSQIIVDDGKKDKLQLYYGHNCWGIIDSADDEYENNLKV